MSPEDISERLFAKIANFLSYRARTKKEVLGRLARYLAKTKYSPEEKEEVIASIVLRLEEMYLLNDEAFVQTYIRQKSESKTPLSNKAMHLKLAGLGISSDLLAKYLSDKSGGDEVVRALKMADKKMKSLASLPLKERKAKLYRFLAGKGFSSEAIKAGLTRQV